MAEFWWGKSPKSAIRQHKNFYTACIGKCQPILAHMLLGMPMDDDPLLESHIPEDALDIVYQDADIVVVNKGSLPTSEEESISPMEMDVGQEEDANELVSV